MDHKPKSNSTELLSFKPFEKGKFSVLNFCQFILYLYGTHDVILDVLQFGYRIVVKIFAWLY